MHTTDEVLMGPWVVDPDIIAAMRLDKARRAFDAGEVDTALVEAEELLEQRPDDTDALRVVGRAALTIGDAAMAASAFNQLVALAGPEEATTWSGLALARLELADFEGGLAAADRALGLDAALAEAWCARAMCLDRVGRAVEAVADYARAHELQPTHYPLPVQLPAATWARALGVARRSLPGPIRAFYSGVALNWAEHPDPELLRAEEPPLNPFTWALADGLPSEDGDPWVDRPSGVTLFRANIAWPPAEMPEIARRIRVALLQEAMHWLAMDEDEEGWLEQGVDLP